jgi:hypothetical protein
LSRLDARTQFPRSAFMKLPTSSYRLFTVTVQDG